MTSAIAAEENLHCVLFTNAAHLWLAKQKYKKEQTSAKCRRPFLIWSTHISFWTWEKDGNTTNMPCMHFKNKIKTVREVKDRQKISSMKYRFSFKIHASLCSRMLNYPPPRRHQVLTPQRRSSTPPSPSLSNGLNTTKPRVSFESRGLSCKMAATYSPAGVQYHRRGRA